MKINFDRKSERAFQQGWETFLVLHIAVNMVLYRGLRYPFVDRGRMLLPELMETAGDLEEIFNPERKSSLWREALEKALKLCSRVNISFYCKDPGDKSGLQQFAAQIHFLSRGKAKPYFSIDLLLKQLRIPALLIPDKGGMDYHLDGSLKWDISHLSQRAQRRLR